MIVLSRTIYALVMLIKMALTYEIMMIIILRIMVIWNIISITMLMITGNKFILLVALLSLLLLFLFIPQSTDKPMIIMMEIIKIVLLITNVNEGDSKCDKSIGI